MGKKTQLARTSGYDGRMTILIVSHTEHYHNAAGKICGWGPTLREIDYLADKYGKVIHVACLHTAVLAPASAAVYQSANVEFVSIPSFGGRSLTDKLKIFTAAPVILNTILTQLRKADIFQFRSPTSMGMYVIPALTWLSSKPGWFKYAGNWMQKKKPLSYAFQKTFLESFQKRPVTINGSWRKQKKHVFTFENPCLNKSDLEAGEKCIASKEYEGPLTACFVGRLEDAKGVQRIIDNLYRWEALGITEIHFAGGGTQMETYKRLTTNASIKCCFYGFIDREKVIEIYEASHLLLLPSTASEGFPKVIAEGANFGCVPVVSDVSSITQYINYENGYIWKVNEEPFDEFLQGIDFHSLKSKATRAREFSELFSFESLFEKLEKHIFP